MKLILHIGIPKTGTTTLQAACHSARDTLLSKYSILYPNAGLWTDLSHHTLGFALKGVSEYAGHPIPSPNAVLNALQVEIAAASRPDYVLVSSEIFQALIWGDSLSALQTLTNLFDETIIVCFVRRQDVLLESLFKQNVKDPEVRLSEPPIDFMSNRLHWFNYKRLLSEWSKTFGLSNIFPVAYSSRREDPIIDKFASVLSSITGYDISINGVDRKNQSLNGKGLEIKWGLNDAISDREENDAFLQYLFEHFDCSSSRKIFNNQQRMKILDNYFESNLWMFENFRRGDWTHFQNVKVSGALFNSLDKSNLQDIASDFRRSVAQNTHRENI